MASARARALSTDMDKLVSCQAPVVVIKKDKKEKHRDETPEERAARKLAKKLKKEAKRAREGGERPSMSEPLSP